MRRALAGLLALLVGLQPTMLRAQQGSAADASATPAPQRQTPPPPINVDAMGISFERIRRGLREKPPSTAKSPLKLEFYVEVVAEAPPILLFQPGELATGPAPFGAPTHRDVLDLLTPIEFKSPSVPVSSIAIMGIQKLIEYESRRARERKAEEARQKRIEAERERQRKLKESIVVQPPKKEPGRP